MCGISGVWNGSDTTAVDAAAAVARMTRALAHRGPDDDGHWLSDDRTLALGHRRLAVVDLSSAGHQPMRSASGRLTIVLNGEIYNHAELRRAVEQSGAPITWRGHSDTETLLAAVELWGL